jgi:hypothetical protein
MRKIRKENQNHYINKMCDVLIGKNEATNFFRQSVESHRSSNA